MLIQVPARLQSYLQDLGLFKPPLPTTFRLSLLCHSQRWLAVPCSALAYPCFVPPPLPDRQSYWLVPLPTALFSTPSPTFSSGLPLPPGFSFSVPLLINSCDPVSYYVPLPFDSLLLYFSSDLSILAKVPNLLPIKTLLGTTLAEESLPRGRQSKHKEKTGPSHPEPVSLFTDGVILGLGPQCSSAPGSWALWYQVAGLSSSPASVPLPISLPSLHSLLSLTAVLSIFHPPAEFSCLQIKQFIFWSCLRRNNWE